MASSRYQPPAVRYPVQRPHGPFCAGLAVWLCAAGLLGAWWAGSGPLAPGVLAMGWLLWLGAGGGLLYSWHAAAQGVLWWDGGAWWWQPAGAAQWQALDLVQVRMDAQSAMWLAWRPVGGRVRYLWVAQAGDPWRWGDWRRAVYSAATVSRMAGNRA